MVPVVCGAPVHSVASADCAAILSWKEYGLRSQLLILSLRLRSFLSDISMLDEASLGGDLRLP